MSFNGITQDDILGSIMNSVDKPAQTSASTYGSGYTGFKGAFNLQSLVSMVNLVTGDFQPMRKDLTKDVVLADTLSRFASYNLIKASVLPKMQLAEDVTVSPEFRVEINKWMRDFFGVTCVVERGTCLFMETHKTVVVHPIDYDMLRNSAHLDQPTSYGILDWGW